MLRATGFRKRLWTERARRSTDQECAEVERICCCKKWLRLRLGHMRAVLEVVLQNLRGEGWIHRRGLWFHGADHFASAYNFRCRQACDFRGQHQINFKLNVG